jgi:hypothetical protein
LAKQMESFQGARYEQRAKRRRVNRILNTLIGAVFLLILFFGGQLLFSNNGDTEEVANTVEKKTVEKKKEHPIEDEHKDKEESIEVELGENQESDIEEEQLPEEDNKQEENQGVTEIEGDPNSNVMKEIVNPSWQPIGTTQSEPHVTTYDQNSVDWKEMLDAVSYATRLSPSEMIVWFIGNNGPNRAVATISTKDQQQHYKVYIEWVEGQGWKPTKVQQLRNRE